MYIGTDRRDYSQRDFGECDFCPTCGLTMDRGQSCMQKSHKTYPVLNSLAKAKSAAKKLSLSGGYFTVWSGHRFYGKNKPLVFTLKAYPKLSTYWIDEMTSEYFPAHICGYYLNGKLKLLKKEQIDRAKQREMMRAFSSDR